MNKILLYVAFAAIFGYAASAALEQEDQPLTVEDLKQVLGNDFEMGEEQQQEDALKSIPSVLEKEVDADLVENLRAARGDCSRCRSYCQRQGKHGWACYNGLCTCF